MKNSIIALVLLTVALGGCVNKVYTNENFSRYQQQHKIVAILPFEVSIDPRKKISYEALADAEKQEGYLFQQQLYTKFKQRSQRNKYTVDFQDIDKTNVLLKRADVSYETLNSFTKEELAEILGVDALISGQIHRSKPMGTGAAVASTLLIGYSHTNKVIVSMNIHEGERGNLLWTYEDKLSGGLGSSSEAIAEHLLKKTSKKFPYSTEK